MSRIIYTRAHIHRYALAAAAYDRKHHPRTWMPDEDVIAGLHGHALAFANANRIQFTISHDDLGFGLAIYRRARRQKLPDVRTTVALPLVCVVGVRRGSAA